MALALTSLIRGPANVTVGANVYYSQGDVSITMVKETFDVSTSAHGIVDTRESDQQIEISFTPAGEYEGDATGPFISLFPGATTVPGSSWFGASGAGTTIVVEPINEQTGDSKHTFHCAKIIRIPQLILAATKPMLGAVTFRAILSNGTTRRRVTRWRRQLQWRKRPSTRPTSKRSLTLGFGRA